MSQDEAGLVSAVVLAGGAPADSVAATQSAPVKGLVTVGGRPMVAYVVEAVHGAGLSPIAVSTSEAALPGVQQVLDGVGLGTSVAAVAAAGPQFTQTLTAGLGLVPDGRPVLLATGDLPLLTAEAVGDFLDRAKATGAELVYSTVKIDALTGPFQSGKRMVVRLRGARLTGGNLVLSRPEVLRGILDRIAKAFKGRKSPIALARTLGFGFVLRLLFGRLDVPAIVKRGERVIGCSAGVVMSEYPEVCFDMDKPEHLAVAEQVLSERGQT